MKKKTTETLVNGNTVPIMRNEKPVKDKKKIEDSTNINQFM